METTTFGDWLAFATTRPDYPGATTGKDLIATAFYAHSTDLMQRIAHVLGRDDDAKRYGELFDKIKVERSSESLLLRPEELAKEPKPLTCWHYSLICLSEELRPVAAKRLRQEVRERKHLTTGFLGTPYICHVLSRYGYLTKLTCCSTAKIIPRGCIQ